MVVVGKYEYDTNARIGYGTFGKVYEGREKTELRKVAAIKEVDTDCHKMRSFPESITRETDILKTLSNPSHKNIVTLFHYEQQGTNAYFVMEYCNGGNLGEYLKSKGKLDERVLRLFLRQIAAGLKVAHDMHIVHRDLKPENILLCFSGLKCPDPDKITLKIADFGMGRFLDADEMANTLCGTPLYMAPEILVGRPHNYKVDLWSVGVIAYECLIGSLPRNPLMAFNDVQIPKNSSEDMVNLLKGLVEKDETKRFNTKKFFNHPFLDAVISVTVVASGKSDTRLIQVNDGKSVDHLIDIVSANYSNGSDVVLLYHDGSTLKRGSGQSIRESDIIDKATVTLVLQLSGGDQSDGRVATYCPSSVSS